MVLYLSVRLVTGQTGPQDLTYTITTGQAWTDTGLDLQSGDLLQISASAAGCDPRGASGEASESALPLPTAPAGALIARLHGQRTAPLLIGASSEVPIKEASHLFLGVNSSGTPPCQGSFLVKVHRVPSAAAATASPTSASSGGVSSDGSKQSETRGEQLKSQLSTAAQIFMQGQFGVGKQDASGSSNLAGGGSADTASAAPLLKVPDAPLDPQLRKDLEGLPRRVNDQFKNLGDMVNFVIVGSQKDLQSALDAANWHPADSGNRNAVLNAVEATLGNKDYLAMPMSTLYLFGRAQDFGYEMAEPIAMVASRHHFRIWKAPFVWKGQEVWVGAGTHDIGFAKDKRNGSITHKIDPRVDGERDNIGISLQKAGKVKSLYYYLPSDAVKDAKNATGDTYQSDGRLLVIFLQ